MSSPATRERKGPNRKAIGEVRGTRWKCPHLSHPSSLRYAGRAPFFSRSAGEDDLQSLSSPATRERKGPVAERNGEVRALSRQSALIYPLSLRDTGPFLLPFYGRRRRRRSTRRLNWIIYPRAVPASHHTTRVALRSHIHRACARRQCCRGRTPRRGCRVPSGTGHPRCRR